MAKEVKMPELGESITEGTITRWLKSEGDEVTADEPLFEVSTDKVDTEVPAPVSGILKEIKAGEDETVEVGQTLAVIDEGASGSGDDAGASSGEETSDEEDEEPEATGGEEVEEAAEDSGGDQSDDEGGDEGDDAADDVAEGESEDEAGAEPDQGEAEADDDEAEEKPAAKKPAGGKSGGKKGGGGGGKATSVTMPALGESITEGTITRWLKSEGDEVAADEPLFEVSTDKVDTEVPSPVAGVLQSIKVGEDETVEVGAEVAVVGGEGAGGGDEATEEASAEDEGEQAAAEGKAGAIEPGSETTTAEQGEAEQDGEGETKDEAQDEAQDDGATEGAVVSPLVRKLVREHGIDLRKIRGTGKGGRVRRQDVLAFIEDGGGKDEAESKPAAKKAEKAEKAPAKEAKPEPKGGAEAAPKQVPLPSGVREDVQKATRTRRVIADRMVASKRISAHLTTAVEIDMTEVMRLRARYKDAFKEREGVSLSPLPFSVLALVAAIREYPKFNMAVDDDFNLHVYKDVNLGVAVDTPKGLFVPVVRGVDGMNLAGIAKAVADVAKRTRDNKINPNELAGSTITVTNTGSVGAVWDTPIINQPNVCILATPAIVKRPAVIEHPELGEVIAIRHMQYGILSYDHRVVDGADAARFLVKFKEVLEAADFGSEFSGYE
jgi:pyruvate dehydrogenase E2 component (dihydrolipoamide acetyltransferase)